MPQAIISRDDYEALLTDKVMLDVEHSEGQPEAVRMSALIDRLNLQIAALKRSNESLRKRAERAEQQYRATKLPLVFIDPRDQELKAIR